MKTMTLPYTCVYLLPSHLSLQKNVVASFDVLMETDFFRENEELLIPLIDYFEDTWIGRPQRGRRRQPVFAHEIWNTFVATTEGRARTNNVEGWHRRFSSLLGAHHPSLWKFNDVLKQEQTEHTEFQLNQLMVGTPAPAKRRNTKT